MRDPAVVADVYDALIWFDRTNPSVLLPFDRSGAYNICYNPVSEDA